MALKKEIELENGISVNYHRIASIQKITNIANIIEVDSYVSEKKRKEEQAYQNAQQKRANNEQLTEEENKILESGINVFVEAEYIKIDYSEGLTIKDAYNYLKSIEKYKNAIDI